MIEPWSRMVAAPIYTHLHHEPFDPTGKALDFPDSGPLSALNGAPAVDRFSTRPPGVRIEVPQPRDSAVRPFMPFRYLVSGGVSMRQLMPEATFALWRKLESWLCTWPRHWSMFALIHLTRR